MQCGIIEKELSMSKGTTLKLAQATRNDPRWAAIVARDASADGTFYYSVKTTGVFCRPSCAARRARPENVQFHSTCRDAELAGFRPCKRCKPNQAAGATHQNAMRITRVCRLIERAQQRLPLQTLAAHAGMS